MSFKNIRDAIGVLKIRATASLLAIYKACYWRM